MIIQDIKDYCKIYYEDYITTFLAPFFFIIAGLVGWGAYGIYSYWGKNIWFLLCCGISVFCIIFFFFCFYTAYVDLEILKKRRIDEENKRIKEEKDAERCKYIEEKYPLAYARYIEKNTVKKDYFHPTTKVPKKSDIAKIPDETWSKDEQRIIKLNRKRDVLKTVCEKYPMSFTRCTEAGCDCRLVNIVMPEDRSMSLYYSLNNSAQEDDKYQLLRDEQGLDDKIIRKRILEDIEKEIKKKINFVSIPIDKLSDEKVENIYRHIYLDYVDRNSNDIDNELLQLSEKEYKEELEYQDRLILFYSEIQGVNERDFYMDAFLKSKGITEGKLNYLVTHIDELDQFIEHSKEMNLNNSKEGMSKSTLISNLKKCSNAWGELNMKPYYFFYYYYPKRFEDVSKESDDARSLIYGFKDGSIRGQKEVAMMLAKKLQDTFDLYDLSQITFVCAPASTETAQYFRFENFALKYACPYTTMKNGVNGVEVTQSGDASHLSQGCKNYEYIVKPEILNEKVVLLFDDIVTSSNTMQRCRKMIENAGATVVLQMSIGRTYSDYHGDIRRPHPWSGKI